MCVKHMRHLNLLCNIHMKHLQHSCKTSETLETYACNIKQTWLPAPIDECVVKFLHLTFYLCADLSPCSPLATPLPWPLTVGDYRE